MDSHGTGQALKVQVGTAAEGTQNLNTTLTVTDYNAGKILDTTFSATKQTTYITLNNPSTATNMDVDYVRISEDVGVKKLRYISYDDLNSRFSETDLTNSKDRRCYYSPIIDGKAGLINDPVVLRHSKEKWWLSIADSDVILYAKGLAIGYNLKVKIDSWNDDFVKYHRISNSGKHIAVNYGIDLAKGDYCIVLDSDDIPKQNAFEIFNKNIPVSYTHLTLPTNREV